MKEVDQFHDALTKEQLSILLQEGEDKEVKDEEEDDVVMTENEFVDDQTAVDQLMLENSNRWKKVGNEVKLQAWRKIPRRIRWRVS